MFRIANSGIEYPCKGVFFKEKQSVFPSEKQRSTFSLMPIDSQDRYMLSFWLCTKVKTPHGKIVFKRHHPVSRILSFQYDLSQVQVGQHMEVN